MKLETKNFTKYGLDLNPVVSVTSGLFILIFSIYAILNLEHASNLFDNLYSLIMSNWDWIFIISSNFFIGVCLYLAFSKLGNVKIGGSGSKPEFTNFAWYSMLLSAGMGIGLMFWAVGEPLTHFNITPSIFESNNDVSTAIATTFFHWGLHPWSIYALLGLSLAFFAYNKNLPLSLRSIFYPLFKEKIMGWRGDLLDTLAVLSCMFGLATSLGLGVKQMNSGLNYIFNIPENTYVQLILITIITLLATISIVAGIHKGIKFLSELNIRLAALLMILIFILGPTLYIIRVFTNGFGLYLNELVKSSFYLSFSSDSWQGQWSIFYLAWWISWSPFVGMFIARMSKGRTVREFILAVLIIPSLISFLWLSVFGGTAIHVNNSLGGELYATVEKNLPVALFELIQHINFPFLSSILVIFLSSLGTLLVMLYFITSSDSGSLVIENITAGGKEDTPKKQRIFWAIIEGLVAGVLLLIGGERALNALQTAVITTGLPFALVLILASFAIIKGIYGEYVETKMIKECGK